jgi:glycosyltransferase involved in cell wall biosynthesis
MAAAKPVVAYDCDGAREVCLQDETGFLLAPGDLSALTERLVQLSRDGPLRQRLGRRGQQLARQWFPVERMLEELFALYRKLVARVSAPPAR